MRTTVNEAEALMQAAQGTLNWFLGEAANVRHEDQIANCQKLLAFSGELANSLRSLPIEIVPERRTEVE